MREEYSLPRDLEARVTGCAVCVLPRDADLGALSQLHGPDSIVPALDDAARAAAVCEGLHRVGREEEARALVRGPARPDSGSGKQGEPRTEVAGGVPGAAL